MTDFTFQKIFLLNLHVYISICVCVVVGGGMCTSQVYASACRGQLDPLKLEL